ncbi:MAG TPA: class I SAM-dependent methyltransferase [Rhodothermales bacterium]|nr:class I SAM-dependent methyltransferase [Rhodothermales bacterium]
MVERAGWRQYLGSVLPIPSLEYARVKAILDRGLDQQVRCILEGIPYDSVLDVGCGTGRWAKIARGRYLGIDPSPFSISRCERRYGNDPLKQFVQADPVSFHLPVRYDLALLIGLFHHLPDAAVRSVLDWVARSATYIFVSDICPVSWNPVSHWLYAHDGEHIREPGEQEYLLSSHPALNLVSKGDCYCSNRLYRHALFLYQTKQLV